MSISADYLMATTWRFSRGDGSVIAPVVRFLPRGVVGGHINPYERSWDLLDGRLVFADENGIRTTVLSGSEVVDGVATRLSGPSRRHPDVVHVLDRVEMPTGLDFGQTSCQTQADIECRRTETSRRRRNLVVLRADRSSLHTSWDRNIANFDRTWDLCVSWYDREEPLDLGTCEYLAYQRDDRKFGAINSLFQPESRLWAYEQIWLPDDDLQTSWRDINRLFEICRRYELQLAQPSLKSNSFVNHPVTAQQPEYILRHTNFVEAMCPLFSRDALKLCLPSFNGAVLGYGLDHIWPRLLGMVHTRMAIVDDVTVAHTRPLASNYDPLKARAEEEQIRSLYRAFTSYSTVGGLLKS